MTGGVTASTVIAGISAAAGIGGTIASLVKGSPKTPDAVTAPAPPSVSQATQMAEQESLTNQRKGALANLLNNGGSPDKMNTGTTSLKTILGG